MAYKRWDPAFKAKIAARVDEIRDCTRQNPHVCAVNGPCNGWPKQERKVLSVIVDEHGGLTYLKTDASDALLEMGEAVTARASHVLPTDLFRRCAFRILRRLFGENGRVAEWTRGWRCLWYVDTRPVGGWILEWRHTDNWRGTIPEWAYDRARWANREEAIAAEVRFLNEFFLTR